MKQETIDSVVRQIIEQGGRIKFNHSPYMKVVSKLCGSCFQDKHSKLYDIKNIEYYENYDKTLQLSYNPTKNL